MYFYKFRSFDTNALTALSNNELWFGKLESQNDPFEGRCRIDRSLSEELKSFAIQRITPKDPKSYNVYFQLTGVHYPDKLSNIELLERGCFQMASEMIGNLNSISRICSFSYYDSSSKNNVLIDNRMWGHYANGLRGFCLVFDQKVLQEAIFESTEKKAVGFKVRYQNEPDELRVSDIFSVNDRLELIQNKTLSGYQIVATAASTKSEHWKHEQEVRFISFSDKALIKYPHHALIKIVIGDKMPNAQVNLLKDIMQSKYPHASIEKMMMRQNSYELKQVAWN
ncbi:DUF2971 domain-containing protein [Shewanella subflava]|uniref:DUF2971 domain-containing protein n=1 Tax=Shewanella subflava TaxID=2986476 RepID=A0ABT3I691_9GAMM|nr:DUF2971 domain-containing protein [Shewanella subflava]MCW3171470.1 DUF2971 domain-containing protein [Shewanella subflava]